MSADVYRHARWGRGKCRNVVTQRDLCDSVDAAESRDGTDVLFISPDASCAARQFLPRDNTRWFANSAGAWRLGFGRIILFVYQGRRARHQ